MAVYGNTPPLIVGEVQLQYVVFVFGHLVDEEFYILDRQEMACGVEHESTAWKARLVVNDDGLHLTMQCGTYVAQQQLAEGRGASVESCCGAAA